MTPGFITESTLVETTSQTDPNNGCEVESWSQTLAFQVVFITVIACSLVFLAIVFTLTIRKAMALRKVLKPEYEPYVDIVDEERWPMGGQETEEAMKRRKEEMDRLYERAPSPIDFGTLSKGSRHTSKSFGPIQEEDEEEIDSDEDIHHYPRSGSSSLPRLSGSAIGTRSMSSHLLRPPSVESHGTLYRTASQEFVESMHKSVLAGEELDKQFAPRLSSDDRRRSSAESSDKHHRKKKILDLESGTLWGLSSSEKGHDSCNSSRRNSSSPIRRKSNWEGPFSIHPTMSPSSPDLGTFTKNAKRLKSFDIQSTPILQRMSDAFGTLGRNTLQYRAHSDLFGDGSNSAGTWNPSKPKRASLDDFVETNATKAKTKKVKKRSLGDLGEMDPALVPKSRSGSTTSEVLVYNRHRRSGVALQEAADFEVHI